MAEKVSLFDSESSDEESEKDIKINKEYANRYDQWREKELLQRYKDLQEEVSTSSSSESEEETPEMDENFFRVLSLLKGNDPRIYDKNFVAFQESGLKDESKPKVKKEKPVSIKDYERQIILEKNEDTSDEDDSIVIDAKATNESELAKLKSAIMDDDDDSDDENCIKSLKPSEKEKSEEETDKFITYLKGADVDLPDDSKKDLTYLRNYWNDPNIDEDEKYLRDFFLNKTYAKKDDDFKVIEELEKLSEDEKFEEELEQFEHKYNFRYEEPDQEFIKRYPRTLGDSLRRKDNKRKLKREEYSERKQREKEQKREELKRLKAVKRKEIEEKFSKLQEVTGRDVLNLDENDIESDFDPDKHDKKMKELFDDEFYSVSEEQKPEFSDDEEIDDEDWNHWVRNENGFAENEQDIEKVEYRNSESEQEKEKDSKSQFEEEMIESTKERNKKGRKKSLFAKIIANPKPIYDPDGKSFDDYLEEYYKLDCEDIIGDMPVRFKYRKVIPNNFGLTVDEILKADDKDLNRWCSIKKTCQYRQEEEELYDVQAFRKKAEIPALKEKVLPSVFSESKENEAENIDDSQIIKQKKKRRKKKKSKADQNVNSSEPNISSTEMVDKVSNETDTSSPVISKHKKKKSAENLGVTPDNVEPDIQSKSSCLEQTKEDSSVSHENSSKRKRKRSKKKKNKVAGEISNIESTIMSSEMSKLKHKEKKRKTEVDDKINGVELKTKKVKTDFDVDTHQSGDSMVKNTNKKMKLSSTGKNSPEQNSNRSYNIHDNAFSNGTFKKKNHTNNKNDSLRKHNAKKKYRSSGKNYNKEINDERLALPDHRLASFGLNPKKFKNMIKYSKRD